MIFILIFNTTNDLFWANCDVLNFVVLLRLLAAAEGNYIEEKEHSFWVGRFL